MPTQLSFDQREDGKTSLGLAASFPWSWASIHIGSSVLSAALALSVVLAMMSLGQRGRLSVSYT